MRNNVFYASATITGRVYVDQGDIEQLLADGVDSLGNPITSEKQAFRVIAAERISAMLKSDMPFKEFETCIDIDSLQCNFRKQ